MQDNPQFFTSLDLFSRYHQIRMTEEAIARSAFIIHDGQWEYVRMSFGLTEAPATFQRAMNEVFHNLVGRSLYVYIDDVMIYIRIFTEYLDVL